MYTNLLLLFAAVIGGWSILRLIGAERERLIQSVPPAPPAPPDPPGAAVPAAVLPKTTPPAKAAPAAPPATAKKK